ncbi:MAG: hypothetical protein AAF697_11645 [Pseudomonadota bacterium]
MEVFTENFGWIEIALFYGIAIGVAFWQWAKMRREVREMRAERLEREAREAAQKEQAGKADEAG